jgi:hypothetical protein
VVTSYTASSQNQGHGISQLFETSAKFLDGADSTDAVTWFSMSDESAGGCSGDWCEWLYDPVTHTLCKREGANAGVRSMQVVNGECKGTVAALDAGAQEVTTAVIIDDISQGPGGTVEKTVVLRKFEKAPVVIYQKLGQFVEMDTDAASPNFLTTPGSGTNKVFSHNSGPGDIEQSGQAVWYEFWGLSGPNFQAEESHDPYTWIICGSAGHERGEEECTGAGGGGIDSINVAEKINADGDSNAATGGDDDGICEPGETCGGHLWAVVKPDPATGDLLGGLDPLRRYGDDLRPSTGADCIGADETDDPAMCGEQGVMVMCREHGTALPSGCTAQGVLGGDGGYTLTCSGGTIQANECESSFGTDGQYGTADDGTIFYREATENKLRAFTRENRAHAFSFINGIGVNHPELCGALTQVYATDANGNPDLTKPIGEANECGDSPSTGTRQVMFQNIQELGATLSCFNCSALGQHTVPDHGFDTYSFKWTPLPGVHIPENHPNSNGTIPEGDGSPDAGF